ncbi:MAG: enoyl-CoA hydratase/isomerase family protein [Rhizobiales bacterium]|nr:3-hydroxyacyl-CoA dehydrogenase NAD-binding domain-containing protein [Hyphomicrobiales bacterium]NRB13282.1 enoyl-CoA hydratase/isomerase family protein [Hyphomicrobiales bacterium]
MSEVVTFTVQENIGIISIDNPPINALGVGVRQGLVKYIDAANANKNVAAIVICAQDRTFPAGADIKEFGQPPLAPHLSDVCSHVENSAKPVIAALFGTVLGGGFELALGAHFRLSTATAKFGFPEVLLGILPGAGGTQRMPRITGALPALKLMISGAPIKASQALELGIIDKIIEGSDIKAEAIKFAQQIVAEKTSIKRTGQRLDGLADADIYAAQIAATRAKLAKTNKLFAPLAIVDCVEAAAKIPLKQGLEFERDRIIACMRTTEHAALVHVFFAERKSAKMPPTEKGDAPVKPRTVNVLGIVGGGTMGAGITVSALNAGLKVIMVERDQDSLNRGIQNVEKVYLRNIAKGRMDAAKMAAIMANYTPSTNYADLSAVDMVIEAVFEQMDVKKAVFKQLDKVLKKDAVLATNTSYLDIDELAAATSRAGNIIGLHFFSPANIMRLLEIVVPAKASAEVVATGFALAKRLGKVAVRAGVCDGFIGNRILSVYAKSAVYMMEDGASPYEIDRAIRDFGYPIGLYQMSDLAGGDIGWDTRKRLADSRDPRQRYVHIDDRICENGWFGQKTGRGYYIYENGARIGTEDPEILAIVDKQRKIAGITPRNFTQDEIMERYMAAMVNEAANVLSEGIALRPSDIDVTFIYGYGFPRHKGGPMKYADTLGLDKILATIERLSQDDPYFWQAAPLLKKLVAEGKKFDSLN